MLIGQHNWWSKFPGGYICEDQKVDGKSVHRVSGDRKLRCLGCGALIPITTSIQDLQALSTEIDHWEFILDRLWHEKYRPVAALCSLIEEADDSPA